jgi:hypothetical protein
MKNGAQAKLSLKAGYSVQTGKGAADALGIPRAKWPK